MVYLHHKDLQSDYIAYYVQRFAYTARIYARSHLFLLLYAQSTFVRSCVCAGIVRLPFALRSCPICQIHAPAQRARLLAIAHSAPCRLMSCTLFRAVFFQSVKGRSVESLAPLFVACTTKHGLRGYAYDRTRLRHIHAGLCVQGGR